MPFAKGHFDPGVNRKAFFSSAAGVAGGWAALAAAAGEAAGGPRRAEVVRAGRSLDDEIWQLADRSFLHVKMNAGGRAGGGLIVEQSELRRFGPPRHVHPNQDEWFYPLVGTYVVEVGDERFELGPGDFLLATRGVPHVWMHREAPADGVRPLNVSKGFQRRRRRDGAQFQTER